MASVPDLGPITSVDVRLKDASPTAGAHSDLHLATLSVLHKETGKQEVFKHGDWIARGSSVTLTQPESTDVRHPSIAKGWADVCVCVGGVDQSVRQSINQSVMRSVTWEQCHAGTHYCHADTLLPERAAA